MPVKIDFASRMTRTGHTIDKKGNGRNLFADRLLQHRESRKYHERQLKNDWNFRHDPLDQSTDSIRLVKVLPTSDEHLLELEIRHADLSARYTALSYTWGPADGVRALLINRRGSEVRYNLWHFLNTMRLENQTGEFWIDALCIDQKNVEEKNHQVQRMGEIYAKAEAVFTWLGIPTLQQADTLFDHARQLSSRPKVSQPPEAIRIEQSQMEPRQPWGLGKLCEELCTNPYWNRLWVVQEISFASSLLIFWGRYSIQHLVLRRYLIAVANGRGALDFSSLGGSIRNTVKLLEASDGPNGISTIVPGRHKDLFDNLIQRFGQHDCLDKRDRVFGLLPLTSDLAGLRVDYSVPRQALFWRVISISKIDQFPKYVANLRWALELTLNQAMSWFNSHDYSNRIAADSTWSRLTVDTRLNYAAFLVPDDNCELVGGNGLGPPLWGAKLYRPDGDFPPRLSWPSNLLHRCRNQQNTQPWCTDNLTMLPELSTIFEVGASSLWLVSRPHRPSEPPEIFAAVLMPEIDHADAHYAYELQVRTLSTESKTILKMAMYQRAGHAAPASASLSGYYSVRSSSDGLLSDTVDGSGCKCRELEEAYSTGSQWALRPTWKVLRCLVTVCM